MKQLLSLFIAAGYMAALIPTNIQHNTDEILRFLRDGRERSGQAPVLSPLHTLLSAFDVAAVQKAGFPVVVWTVNEPARMRALLEMRVDGIISDRPDLLMAEACLKTVEAFDTQADHVTFDAQAHRGGRDLRPENTLPSFESGLDNLVTTLETDTGVTKDGVSLISHEQFINPQTCRTFDGSAFGNGDRVWIKDVTMAEAQAWFVCDKTFRGPQQRNDLAMSPVAVAFAAQHKLRSPYVPTNAGQLFKFVEFYADYYRNGAGKGQDAAERRWRNAARVRFNLETKLTPESTAAGQTKQAQAFIDALCGAIMKAKLETRADVQSFDFRTLRLVEEQHKAIRTSYLIESTRSFLSTP